MAIVMLDCSTNLTCYMFIIILLNCFITKIVSIFGFKIKLKRSTVKIENDCPQFRYRRSPQQFVITHYQQFQPLTSYHGSKRSKNTPTLHTVKTQSRPCALSLLLYRSRSALPTQLDKTLQQLSQIASSTNGGAASRQAPNPS